MTWHLLDAKDAVLGRLAGKVASLLIGKDQPSYVAYNPPRTFVVVINTDHLALTGTKESTKLYRHFTGYPGGIKTRTAGEQRARDSRKIVYDAVLGMLPKNNLRKVRLKRLRLFRTGEHPHQAQLAKKNSATP